MFLRIDCCKFINWNVCLFECVFSWVLIDNKVIDYLVIVLVFRFN